MKISFWKKLRQILCFHSRLGIQFWTKYYADQEEIQEGWHQYCVDCGKRLGIACACGPEINNENQKWAIRSIGGKV